MHILNKKTPPIKKKTPDFNQGSIKTLELVIGFEPTTPCLQGRCSTIKATLAKTNEKNNNHTH